MTTPGLRTEKRGFAIFGLRAGWTYLARITADYNACDSRKRDRRRFEFELLQREPKTVCAGFAGGDHELSKFSLGGIRRSRVDAINASAPPVQEFDNVSIPRAQDLVFVLALSSSNCLGLGFGEVVASVMAVSVRVTAGIG